jgi:tRNA wybutosine-synthesizing protein 4
MCKNARFIDVDLPSVIFSKRSTILQTPALLELLDADYHTSKQDSDALMLKSAKYCQIGCDFTKMDILRDTAGSLITTSSKVLVVAEMSLMYNDVKSTEALLSWAKTELQADFCILEHCFPAGADHPLAVKLLQDYQKGQTPLRTIHTYPTTGAQYQRFKDHGWEKISTWDLWEIWTRDDFTDSVERAAIDKAEPFDEWEDLILLARHSFVLSASDRVRHDEVSGVKCAPAVKLREASCIRAARQSLAKNPRRKFGGLVCDTTAEGAELAMHMLGESSTGLSDNYDALTFSSGSITARLPTSGPSPRSCFTVTDLDHAGVIVVGGKSTAINKPLSDCWIYHRGPSPYWKKTWDLPNGIYRHSAIRLGRSSMVLVMGGKSARGVSSECFVFHPDKGWHRCVIDSTHVPSLFGASTWQTQLDGPIRVGNFQGVLCGGLNAATKPNLDMFRWHLDTTTSEVGTKRSLIRWQNT